MKKIILPYSLKDGFISDARNVPTIDITENGTYDVKAYDVANVNVAGGGGSSDFSTAKVVCTIEESITESFYIKVFNVYGNDMFDGLETTDLDPEGINAVLYKGKASVYALPNSGVMIKEVSGDATRLDNWHANITGDCTITFTRAIT